ncbi:MAG: precorrin-6A reductase [Candidatus Caldatribacteriaceae bacterium]
MVILILGGTKEGREIAEKLISLGFQIMVSVTTSHGADLLERGIGIEIHKGPLDKNLLREICRKRGVETIIDATHPFAQLISKTAIDVAEEEHIRYIRYERKPLYSSYKKLWIVNGFSEAREALRPFKTIFLTIGFRYLHEFIPLRKEGKKLIARIMPFSFSLQRCEEMGFSPQEIIAIHGPCSVEMNYQMFMEFQVEVVVSKESGREGGLTEKAQAAQKAGIPIVVIKRPVIFYPTVIYEKEDLFRILET